MFERLGHVLPRVLFDLVSARADWAAYSAWREGRDLEFDGSSLDPRASAHQGRQAAGERHELQGRGYLRALRPVR